MGFSENIKKEVRKLSHFSCCLCKNVGIEIHHITSQEDGGTDDLNNAAPLCPTCHGLYGGNPSKRKMIREARDQWYKICSKRYASNEDRLSELAQKIDDLKTLQEEIPNKIITKLKKEDLATSDDFECNKLPLSKVVEKILRFKHDLEVPNKESVHTTYAFLYTTEGDPNSKKDKEYNQIRDEFTKKFGTLVTHNICIYLVSHYKIDWLNGVPESKLLELLSCSFVTMVMLLHHEEIDNDWKLEIGFTKNTELIAQLKKT